MPAGRPYARGMLRWRIVLVILSLVLAGPLGLRPALAFAMLPAAAAAAVVAAADEPCAHEHDGAANAQADAALEHCGQSSACAAACASACAPTAAVATVTSVHRSATRTRLCTDEAIPPGRTIAPEPPPPTA